jgi:hypothetical protein
VSHKVSIFGDGEREGLIEWERLEGGVLVYGPIIDGELDHFAVIESRRFGIEQFIGFYS